MATDFLVGIKEHTIVQDPFLLTKHNQFIAEVALKVVRQWIIDQGWEDAA